MHQRCEGSGPLPISNGQYAISKAYAGMALPIVYCILPIGKGRANSEPGAGRMREAAVKRCATRTTVA